LLGIRQYFVRKEQMRGTGSRSPILLKRPRLNINRGSPKGMAAPFPVRRTKSKLTSKKKANEHRTQDRKITDT
jgi:hypothetical protein